MPCLYRVLALAPAATSTATSRCTMVDDALSVSIVDLKPLREATVAVPAPKITEKRKAEDADASKDLKKAHALRRHFQPAFSFCRRCATFMQSCIYLITSHSWRLHNDIDKDVVSPGGQTPASSLSSAAGSGRDNVTTCRGHGREESGIRKRTVEMEKRLGNN
ncbi:hypothetical protein ALC62_15767 [Cyphomyrmex costatus]|uniref:Uncharacterized protein n=1 Tax=Cyphomyrmex costatus TaxID=456900 RepID=A0A151I6X4_9HYME|nr:hypothetical protein ALC62_15767 [Cyphomyrmex costatus]